MTFALLIVIGAAPAKAPGVYIELLWNPAVQQELKLEPRIIQQVRGVLADLQAAQDDALMEAFQRGARPRDPLEIHAVYEERVKKVLTQAQWKRLGELTVQACGPGLLTQDEYAAWLKLSPEQRARIAGLFEGPAALKIETDSLLTAEQIKEQNEAREKARAAAERAALEVLNQGQRTEWRAMQGKPFDWSRHGP
jgi:hypothetical protein